MSTLTHDAIVAFQVFCGIITMEVVYATLTQRVDTLQRQASISTHKTPRSRIIIALSGPPGSGKTTVAREVAQRLNTGLDVPTTVVVSMDGFHYPRSVLDTFPQPDEAHARRGAAFAFDALGVVALVKKLKTSSASSVFAPSFDHAIKDPVLDDVEIPATTSLVILEGNWLLYNSPPWDQICDLVDDTWFIDVDRDIARDRVARRHVESGLETNMEAALARAEANDVPNGDEIRTRLIQPAVIVHSVELVVV